jgi:hypothetical protein
MAVENKHVQKFKDMIREEVVSMFEQTLDYAQVACPEPNFKPLRSKILRVGNNCIRNIHRKIDAQYEIEFKATVEDIVEIKR